MDQRPGSGGARGLGDITRPIDVDGLHLAAEHADKVDYRLGVLDGAADTRGVGYVGLDEAELPDLAQRLDEIGVARIARGDAHPDSAFHQELADVAADEAVAAEHRDQLIIPLDHSAALASCRRN